MDSDDLSLIEMECEDDSLIKQACAEDIDNFACSPLTIPGSHCASGSHRTTMMTIENNTCTRVVRPPPLGDKENVSTSNSKSELNTLNLEPQKMKRSRKYRALNLRQSLAWDKAFLTEEGVLSASELSMICGTNVGSEGLSAIFEEPSEPSKSIASSILPNLQTLEANSSTKATCPRKVVAGYSPLKSNSKSQANLAASSREPKKKLLPRVKHSVSSDRGCTKSYASVSQKRPLIVSPAKPAKRNAKVTSAPVAKPDTRSRQPTTRNARLGSALLNTRNGQLATSVLQHAHPTGYHTATSVQKHVNPKGSPSTKRSPSAAKMGSRCISRPAKTDQNARMKMAIVTAKEHPSTNRKLLLDNQPSSSDAMLDKKLPPSKNEQKSTLNMSSKVTVLSHTNNDDARPSSTTMQDQKVKPSGLRMPTPSLRFFSETKNSLSHGVGQTNIRPSKIPRPGIPLIKNQGAKGQTQSDELKLLNTTGEEDGVMNGNLTRDGQVSAEEPSVSTTIGIKPHHVAIQHNESALLLRLQSPSNEKTVTTLSNGSHSNSDVVKETEMDHEATLENDGFKPHHVVIRHEEGELMWGILASSDENTTKATNSGPLLNHAVDDVKTIVTEHEQTSLRNERVDGKHGDSFSSVVTKEEENEITNLVQEGSYTNQNMLRSCDWLSEPCTAGAGNVSVGESEVSDTYTDNLQSEVFATNKGDLKLVMQASSDEKIAGTLNSGPQLNGNVEVAQKSEMAFEQTLRKEIEDSDSLSAVASMEADNGISSPVQEGRYTDNTLQSSDWQSEPGIAVAGRLSPGPNEVSGRYADTLQRETSATNKGDLKLGIQASCDEKIAGSSRNVPQLNDKVDDVKKSEMAYERTSLRNERKETEDIFSISSVVSWEADNEISSPVQEGRNADNIMLQSSDWQSKPCIAVAGKVSPGENEVSHSYADIVQFDLVATNKGDLKSGIRTSSDENTARTTNDGTKLNYNVDDAEFIDMEFEQTSSSNERKETDGSVSLSPVVIREAANEFTNPVQEGSYTEKNMLQSSDWQSEPCIPVAGKALSGENDVSHGYADIGLCDFSATNEGDLDLGIQAFCDEKVVGTTNNVPLLNVNVDDVKQSAVECEQTSPGNERKERGDMLFLSPVGSREADNEITSPVQISRHVDNMIQRSVWQSKPCNAVAGKVSAGENEVSDSYADIVLCDSLATNKGDLDLEIQASCDEKVVGTTNNGPQLNDNVDDANKSDMEYEQSFSRKETKERDDSISDSPVISREADNDITSPVEESRHTENMLQCSDWQSEPSIVVAGMVSPGENEVSESCADFLKFDLSATNKGYSKLRIQVSCDEKIVEKANNGLKLKDIGDAQKSDMEWEQTFLRNEGKETEDSVSFSPLFFRDRDTEITSLVQERGQTDKNMLQSSGGQSEPCIAVAGKVSPDENRISDGYAGMVQCDCSAVKKDDLMLGIQASDENIMGSASNEPQPNNDNVDDVKRSDMDYEQTFLGNERMNCIDNDPLSSVVTKEADNENTYLVQEGRYTDKYVRHNSGWKSGPWIAVAGKASPGENESSDSYAGIMQCDISGRNRGELLWEVQAPSELKAVGRINSEPQLNDNVDDIKRNDMDHEESSLILERKDGKDSDSLSLVVTMGEENALSNTLQKSAYALTNVVAGEVPSRENQISDIYDVDVQCDMSAVDECDQFETEIDDALYSCIETCYDKSVKAETGDKKRWALDELQSPVPAVEELGHCNKRFPASAEEHLDMVSFLETNGQFASDEVVKETSLEKRQVLSLSEPIEPGEQSALMTNHLHAGSSCSGLRRQCKNLIKSELTSCNTKLLLSPDTGSGSQHMSRLSVAGSFQAHIFSNEAGVEVVPLHQNPAKWDCLDDKSESLSYTKPDGSDCRESRSPTKHIEEQLHSEIFQDPSLTFGSCETGVSLDSEIGPEDYEAWNHNQSVVRDKSVDEMAHLDLLVRPSRTYEVSTTTSITDDDKVSCFPSEAPNSPARGVSMDVSECRTQQETLPCMDVQDETVTKSISGEKKQTDLVIKPSVNAAPFSEEWLAAIEAAGEVISFSDHISKELLTLKSGRVQNSPPSTSSPEPGPWSPVKRKKTKSIGPFDCTKFTKPEE